MYSLLISSSICLPVKYKHLQYLSYSKHTQLYLPYPSYPHNSQFLITSLIPKSPNTYLLLGEILDFGKTKGLYTLITDREDVIIRMLFVELGEGFFCRKVIFQKTSFEFLYDFSRETKVFIY